MPHKQEALYGSYPTLKRTTRPEAMLHDALFLSLRKIVCAKFDLAATLVKTSWDLHLETLIPPPT